MATESLPPLIPARLSRVLGWSALYFVLFAGIFTFPKMPETGLDPSWRMVLGYAFENGMQFGRDVVFTYGPLGFLMGNTFSGVQFWNLIVGQVGLAVIAATVIILQGSRLTGNARLIYFGFFLFYGIYYVDALHMLVITILGFALLRDRGDRWNYLPALIAAVLALYAQIKFTNFMLSAYVVLVACAYGLWRKRWRDAVLISLGYVTAFLAIWVLCGQNPANLPDYFRGSLAISDGYQWVMGLATPSAPFWKGLVILLAMVAYGLSHLKLNPDKPRAAANVLVLGAFIYLNWKHGFVRSDGHMVGFFFCAMLPMAAYPALLDDPDRFRRTHRWVIVALIVLSVWGIENALIGMSRGAMGMFQNKVWSNVESVIDWSATRQTYRDILAIQRKSSDLYQIREMVGRGTIDVLGEDQSVAILGRFNYQPRPVIQSYSTFTPLLAQLNYDFYASKNAPEFILANLQTIDGRLPTMDDSLALRLLVYRYEFQRNQKGFYLWRKHPGAFDPAKFEPKVVRRGSMAIGAPLALASQPDHPLWLKVDLQPSLLGALRNFFYKPPQVRLSLKNHDGSTPSYLMPLPMARAGFIIHPFIDDPASFMEFSASRSKRQVDFVTVVTDPSDRKFFADSYVYELSELPPPSSGEKYFASTFAEKFHMFSTYPIAYDAQNPLSEAVIDGRDIAVLHAPSLMTFDLPAKATRITGRFGFMEGAYSKGGKTNGAEFVVYWSNGYNRVELFRKYLDPVNLATDRGLHEFRGELGGLTGGRVYLQINPGPYNDFSWDWTGWTDVEIK